MSEVAPQNMPNETPLDAPDEAPDMAPLTAAPDEEEEAAEAEEEAGAAPDETEPAEAQAVSQKQIEQVWKKFEKSSAVWRKRVGEIMEGDIEVLMACPMCDPLIPGYVMPAPDVPERFPAVRSFMGDAQPAEYRADPNTRQCQTCGGEGVVETGSKVEGQVTLVCTDCGGKGWQGARAPVATSGPMAPALVAAGNGESQPTPQGPEPPEAAKLRALGYLVAPLAPV